MERGPQAKNKLGQFASIMFYLRLTLVMCVLLADLTAVSGKKRANHLKCFKLPQPSNGILAKTFKADVYCEAGYTVSEDNITEISCRKGGQIGIQHCEGGIATYSCDRGFGLVGGSAQRICQPNGQWSGSEPTCERLMCTNSIASSNGQVCCPLLCGSQCGGPGCSELTGGATACCQSEILRANVACDSSSAPCVLYPISDDQQTLLDEVDEVTYELSKKIDIKLAVLGSLSVDVRSPSLGINYIIALDGVFPTQNRRKRSTGNAPLVGTIVMFAGNFAPRGWDFCEGQLLPTASNPGLFSILGVVYGGDGRTTFGLPDLRGRTPIQQGTGPGLSQIRLGQKTGSEESMVNSKK